MDPIVATFVILGLAVIAFLTGRIPVAIVAVGVSVALWATGVLDLREALAGFGDPTVVFIATLFVVSEGLDASGVTGWVGQAVVRLTGSDARRALVVVMIVVALLTALISVNGAVAALLPMAVIVAVRSGIAPSRLLLPLAFGAHAGSMLTLTGTPVNVLIAELALDSGAGTLGYFEFAKIGVPLVIATVLVTLLFGRRLIPDRAAASGIRDLSGHTATIRKQYPSVRDEALVDRELGITEAVVPPRSKLIGKEVFPGMVGGEDGSIVLLAILRNDREETRPIALQPGDVLLMQGSWDRLEARSLGGDLLVVDHPDALRRQLAPFGWRGWVALGVLAAMVVVLATDLLPAAIAGLLAAGAMILTRIVPIARAFRRISWTTVVLVAGMIPLSTAFLATGAADLVASGLLAVVGDSSPYLVLLALGVVVLALGQVISNMATALILSPVAIAVAGELGMSPLPFLMAVTTAAAAAFLTPVATPVNLMVMGPAGYRFGDYARYGWPLALVFLAAAVFLTPVFWPFQP
ncbi:SLC13 family permease [Agromyces sp. MMS24-JH15]|uniref:SLC13 family permease n=1 Tax=Agromyces sp. MMS24-JH15 TaxID=3243765 RepID=UPI00374859B4